MPSKMHLDSDHIDDYYQYGPDDPMFAPKKRAPASPSDMGKLKGAYVGIIALVGISVHFLALTNFAGTVAQVSFFTMLGAPFACVFPRTAAIGAVLFLVAGFSLVVGVIAYLVHGP